MDQIPSVRNKTASRLSDFKLNIIVWDTNKQTAQFRESVDRLHQVCKAWNWCRTIRPCVVLVNGCDGQGFQVASSVRKPQVQETSERTIQDMFFCFSRKVWALCEQRHLVCRLSRDVFGVDLKQEPQSVAMLVVSHLARTNWLLTFGYKELSAKAG